MKWRSLGGKRTVRYDTPIEISAAVIFSELQLETVAQSAATHHFRNHPVKFAVDAAFNPDWFH